jgi:flagellar protein FliO/FliZ
MTNWLSFTFSFAIVLALLGGLLFMLKKMQNGNLLGMGQRRIRVIETLSTGPRQKLILMHVNNKEILIGVTAQNMSTLASFDLPEEEPDIDTESAKPDSDSNMTASSPLAQRFADLLKSVTNSSANKNGK